MKLKLTLTKSDFQALDMILQVALTRRTMEMTKVDIYEYLVSATLYELYVKVHKKFEDLRLFGDTGKTARLSLTRPEALALHYLLQPDVNGNYEVALAADSYEFALLLSINNTIHQTYIA